MNKVKSNILIIKKTILPDIHNYKYLPIEYKDYGRWAHLTDHTIWIGNIMSPHPFNTLYGGYWAINNEKTVLYISPRGNTIDLDNYLTKDVIISIANKLRLRIIAYKII
jgi:hypothetical protein